MPGGWLSAAKRALPVTLRRPSRRVSGWPMFEPCRTCGKASGRTVSSGMTRSGNGRERGTGKGGEPVGRSGCRFVQRADDDPARHPDLEGVVSRRLGTGERRLSRASEDRFVRARADENFLSGAGPPRPGGHAAEGEPRLCDLVAFLDEGRSYGDEGEGIGGALT